MPVLLAFATIREASSLGALGAPKPNADEPAPWRFRGRDLLLGVVGVGPVAAALHMGAFLARHTPSGVINLGAAGAFDLAATPMGTAVAATLEIWPEYGLRQNDRVDPEGIRLPQTTTAAGPVRDRLELDPDAAAGAMGLGLPEKTARGPSLTVAGVSGDAGRAALYRDHYAPATENMEGFACALACERSRLPFLEIRIVSNLVGSRDKADWDLPGALARLAQTADLLFA